MCYALSVKRKEGGNDMMSNSERAKKWRANNPEKVNEMSRKWRSSERGKETMREWRKNHSIEMRKASEKYRNKNKGNDTNKSQPYTTKEIDLILNKDFSDTELAKMLNRSIGAIQVARSRYKNG